MLSPAMGVNVGSSVRALIKGIGSVPMRSTEKRVGQERVIIVLPYSCPLRAGLSRLACLDSLKRGLACPDPLKIGGGGAASPDALNLRCSLSSDSWLTMLLHVTALQPLNYM